MTDPNQPADPNPPQNNQPPAPFDSTPQAPMFGSQPAAQPGASPQPAATPQPGAAPQPGPQTQPPPPPQSFAGQAQQAGFAQQPGQQMQPVQPGGFPAHQQQGAVTPVYGRKDPAIMLLASFFIPGLGSMLAERVGKGVGILIAYFISCALIFVIVGFLTTPVIWILGMVAAFKDAKDWNRAHGFPE